MTDAETRVLAHIDGRRAASVEEIRLAIRQPSVSRTGEGVAAMAASVRDALTALGADARLVPGDRFPIVEGTLVVDPALPTLLFYDLYDVQPAAGQQGWSVPPFAADMVTDAQGRERLVGRGAFNSKGPLIGTLATLRAFTEAGVALPCNFRFLIEGEEEVGSPGLPAYISANRAALAACDAAFIPYFGTNGRGETIIRLGFKGLVLVEFRVAGGDWGGPARGDIHAANGALVDSPSWHLVRALASLVDAQDRLVVDGLSDIVPPPASADLALIETAAQRFDAVAHRADLGVTRLKDLGSARALLSELMLTCTLNIDALQAGRIEEGEGAATLIPRTARALTDLRVVPGVAPEAVLGLIRAHLDRRGFQHVEVLLRSAYPASRATLDEPVVAALIDACSVHAPDVRVLPIHAGAAPMHWFSDVIGIPYAFGGVGHGAGSHGPDEYILVDDVVPFMKSMASFFYRFAQRRQAASGKTGPRC
ncbi:M20/M25/M40 family metallo-hydrolase [Limobrevibacterium gyesilva]|uniref:M20/M25/M40 family metallo-hydrolase n=1 Tax=Limobrevibacterium gyesilva TaxID=2991712 RepID=A0AA41YRB6_9PROT|nr:M20/M25/M40 family metallo-hydrolase [Limobrevibacterium gyesilva]MCW3477296.1 M20/M25/M40 family metallo-hydrolase [Limobrevibacterium gyesilva]